MRSKFLLFSALLCCIPGIRVLAKGKLCQERCSPKSFTIMKKVIDLENSPILLEDDFKGNDFDEKWTIKTGEWHVEGGWCYGQYRENAPGMIVSKGDFTGDVLVEFDAQNVLPSDHDINVMWNGSWDDKSNKRDVAYVAGLQGWWEGKVGIEKSPEYKLNAGTPLFDYEPGKVYHIIAGSIEGHCFMVVNGKLLLEVTDPDPIDGSQYGKVGFEAYCSSIRITNVKVRRIKWEPKEMRYEPNF